MAKRILIWTAQIAKYRSAKRLGIPFIDITALSGLRHFAPEMRNVKLYKSGQMGEEEYTRIYIDKMRGSVQTNRPAWDGLEQYDKLIVACYCRAGQFCHRHIWLKLVTKYFARKGIVVVDMGEFLQESDLTKPIPEVQLLGEEKDVTVE